MALQKIRLLFLSPPAQSHKRGKQEQCHNGCNGLSLEHVFCLLSLY